MKHNLICIVLFLAVMHVPAPSKECGKVIQCTVATMLQAKEKPLVVHADAVEEVTALPMSPLSRLFVNL